MQVISILGAILVLVAFAGHQTKRLGTETVTYQVMNLFGGALMTMAAVSGRQYGFILLEGTWTIVSAAALWRVVVR